MTRQAGLVVALGGVALASSSKVSVCFHTAEIVHHVADVLFIAGGRFWRVERVATVATMPARRLMSRKSPRVADDSVVTSWLRRVACLARPVLQLNASRVGGLRTEGRRCFRFASTSACGEDYITRFRICQMAEIEIR